MKAFTTVLKILAVLAAVAGAVYAIATYGDKIVAWAKGLMAKCPCKCGCDEDVEKEPAAEEATCEEPAPAEEAPVEETAPDEEAAPAEEPVSEDGAPVADEDDFEG